MVVVNDCVDGGSDFGQQVSPVSEDSIGLKNMLTGRPKGRAIKPVEGLSDGDEIGVIFV